MPKDTAKATFDTAIKRAEYLLRLAFGLTNHRQRRIRRDWAASFKQVMHWPKSKAIERIDSKDAVIILRHVSNLSLDDFSSDALQDCLRASLVMAVSALDAYFHAKIIRYVVQHSRTKEPSKKLLNAKILVRDFIEGRKKRRSNVALRAAIERNLSYQALQQPAQIAEALCLIGVSNFWKSVAKQMGQADQQICTHLTKIVKRRNQIVHEGDLNQSKKARNKSRPITHKEVEKSIALLKGIVSAAEAIINQQVK